MSNRHLLHVSDFCSVCPPRLEVQLRISSSAQPDDLTVYASRRVLRRAGIVAHRLVRLQYKSTVIVPIGLCEGEDDNDSDTTDLLVVYLSFLTATNLGLFPDHNHTIQLGTLQAVREEAVRVADMVTLVRLGRPWRQNSTLSDTSTVQFPKPSSLLQPDTICAVPQGKETYYYHVVEINTETTSHQEACCYRTTSSTRFRLATSPGPACPRLPPLNDDTILPPHPSTKELVEALSLPPDVTMAERVWHVVGTDEQHHVNVAVEAAAARLGRICVTVRGLACFGHLQGNSVTTGGLADKLVGLEAALEDAVRHAPAILHLCDMHSEWSSFDAPASIDEQERMWALIMEHLQKGITNTSCLVQMPSVLVVLSTARPLTAGPFLENLVYESIHVQPPDRAYTSYLWQNHIQQVPMPEACCVLLESRSAHEIVQLCRAVGLARKSRNEEEQEDDSWMVAMLKDLVAQRDEERRKHELGLAHVAPVHWEDVGGLAHVRGEILNAIELPLQYPHLLTKRHAGILLYGPPGTGKTLVAKAVATECGLPFLSIKGPELLGSFVGESEAQVRTVFAQARALARKNQPDAASILFFDELDSLAPRRGEQASGGNVMDRVVASLFAELDKTQTDCSVFVIGATNRPDLLDPALLRPGRLERLVYLGMSPEDRPRILATQIRKLRLEGDADEMAAAVVQELPFTNLTGADLSTIATGALLRATERLCRQADEEVERLRRLPGNEHTSLDQVLASWDEDRLEPAVCLQDLMEAASGVVPSVSDADMEKYERLREQFRM